MRRGANPQADWADPAATDRLRVARGCARSSVGWPKLALIGGGFTRISSGGQPDTYAYTNFSEDVSIVMRQLLFKPAENRIAGSNTETTVFSILVLDKADRNFPTTNLTDSTTTTITVPANDRPTIVGANATTVTITDSQTHQPFPGVVLADVDELGQQNLTVTVSLDDAAKGDFLPLGGVSQLDSEGSAFWWAALPALAAATPGWRLSRRCLPSHPPPLRGCRPERCLSDSR